MSNSLSEMAKVWGLWVLVIVHFFGVLVISFADLDFFAGFTPFNLVLSSLFIFAASAPSDYKKLAIFAFISVFIGYWAEVLGTKTGFPFGNYWYLHNLGPKVLDVPLLIGINWFLLAYSTALWAKKLSSSIWLRAALASATMVVLDLFIEPLSATLGFWQWEDNVIPWQNYFGWFGVAFIIQLIFVSLEIKTDNPLARWYLPIIGLFFMMLNIFL